MDEYSVGQVMLSVNASVAAERNSDLDARMAARYGTDRSRWPTLVIASIVVAAFFGTAFWAVLGLSDQPFEGTVVRWQAEGQRVVRIDMEVRGSSDQDVVCAVRAKDASASDVGYAYLTFTESPDTRTFRMPTIVQTSSVEVLECASADQDLIATPPDYPPGVAPPPTSPLP